MISDERSKQNLIGVRPELVLLAENLSDEFDFNGVLYYAVVTDGLRTLEEQKEYVKSGVSNTLNSRHLTGHAIDISLYRKDNGEHQTSMPVYAAYSKIVLAKAKQLGIKLTWGGSWASPKDGYHYQLTWADYPIDGAAPRTIENSKTIAAAGAGIPIAAFVPELLGKAKELIGSLSFLDASWIGGIQIGLLLFIAGYIILERKRKIERDGI